jgi:two-component system phosphate regulon response regulator PhoB
VISVDDGYAALRHARQQPPDLAILDVRMPRLSGIDVCRELRAGVHTARIPVIILTARARPQDLEQAYAVGATDYVVKPFSPRDLLERVETVLARVAG